MTETNGFSPYQPDPSRQERDQNRDNRGFSTQPVQPVGQHADQADASRAAQGSANYQAYQVPTGQPTVPPMPQYTTVNAASKGKADHKKMGAGRTFLYGFAGAALACVVGFGGFGVWQAASGTANAAPNPVPTQQTAVQLGAQQNTPLNAESQSTTLPEVVANKCLPSVAAIDVYTDMANAANSLYGFDMGQGGQGGSSLQQSSAGSGVVMTADGYVITNNHVIDGGDVVKVTIEGKEYEAEVVGTDPSSDIAVIKAKDASGLTPMDLGDSDNLTIGEWVMTLGSPFGLEQSVATGIVSATSRSQIMNASVDEYGNATEATIYPNMIQTDAAINPGNSGGALVNADGALIGINTLITSYSGNYSGVGFAIPVNYAVSIAEQIIDGQAPTHAQLGVSLSTVTEDSANRYGFSVTKGAYIALVTPNSGAAEAGLVEGDIVTAFDGKAVESADDLMLDVRSKQPGDKVTLTVVSGGETRDVEVTLGSDANSEASAQEQSEQGEGEQGQNPDEGYGYGDGNDYGYGYGDGNDYGYGYGGGSILDELFGLMN
ncbi:S1C family serine protease [Xiamenia xianingshaonis]|nr:trypsin-like peptidase domain-containing protein [Xiamenia xianingshaonis]